MLFSLQTQTYALVALLVLVHVDATEHPSEECDAIEPGADVSLLQTQTAVRSTQGGSEKVIDQAQTRVSTGVRQYNVNLDLPPADRWTEITLEWADHIEAMMKALDTMLLGVFDDESTWEEWLQAASATLTDDHRAEIQGMLDTLHGAGKTDVSLRNLYAMNFVYELESPVYCSGLLAVMPNGTVVHGRNLDYSFHFEFQGELLDWPDVTFDVTFWRNNEPLFTTVHWPSQIASPTAMRFGGWSIEQNTRGSKNNLWENFNALKAGAKPYKPQLRAIMETTQNFEDALDAILNTKFAAPQYFIMAGALPYEAAVITIDRGGERLPGTPPVQRLNASSDSWYILQTNDDVNQPDMNDPRRMLVDLRLKNLSSDIVSKKFVEDFMITPPLFSPIVTSYTWVAVPATGYHHTLTRPQAAQLAQSLEAPSLDDLEEEMEEERQQMMLDSRAQPALLPDGRKP